MTSAKVFTEEQRQWIRGVIAEIEKEELDARHRRLAHGIYDYEVGYWKGVAKAKAEEQERWLRLLEA